MKNALFLIVALPVILTTITGCTVGNPATRGNAVTPGNPTATPMEESLASEHKAFPQTEATLFDMLGESQVTIAQLEERFGKVSSVAASYSSGTGNTSVSLRWYDAEHSWESLINVDLEVNGESLSFFEAYDDGDGHLVTPTAADKEIPMRPRLTWWTRADVSNARGIQMGMTLEDIQEAYLESVYLPYDLEAYCDDAMVPYAGQVDGTLHTYTLPLSKLTIGEDYIIPNGAPDYYEYAVFYFKEGTLVAMGEGNAGLTFTP